MVSLTAKQFFQAFSHREGRLLAVDVGSKTLGFALSGRSFALASPFQTIQRSTWKKDIFKIQQLIQEQNVIGLIVGLPLNMDGSEGERCCMVRKWVTKLLTFLDIPVYFWDERLSTVAATDIMVSADLSRKRRQELVDKVAASYILQSFFEHHPGAF